MQLASPNYNLQLFCLKFGNITFRGLERAIREY